MAFIAPAGTPLSMRDIALAIAVATRMRPGQEQLVQTLRQLSGHGFVWSLSSGRAAMTLLLRAMYVAAGNPDRTQIIIPAYTCYSVPAAVERAGLEVRLCDVDPGTLGMDPDELLRCDFSRVLAVISANLYGVPNDLAAYETICRSKGVYLLDDAAQALGARLGNRAVGSFGDAGIFSFDKGKIISTMQGGAIVCAEGRLATALGSSIAQLPDSSLAEQLLILGQLVGYSIFLHPSRYGLIRHLPFIGLGRTEYQLRYPITILSALQTNIAGNLLLRLEDLNSARRENARKLFEALQDLPGLHLIRPLPDSHAVYARFPCRIASPEIRARVIEAMHASGIGATASYPRSLADVPEVGSRLPAGDLAYPGATELAATILTLPTHAYCPDDLGSQASRIFRKCAD